jgi:uncharacterized protein YggE
MENINIQKLLLCIAGGMVGLGILIAGFGFGYKEYRDAKYLNVDPAKVVYSKGVYIMDVRADRTVISFVVTGKGNDEQHAHMSFIKNEKEMLNALDKESLSNIRMLSINQYNYEDGVKTYYKSRGYEIVFDNASEEKITSIFDTLSMLDLEELYIRYTLQNPEEKYKILTDKAIENAKNQAMNNVRNAGGTLGELIYVTVGTYSTDAQSFSYDNASDFFYSMPASYSRMTQTATVSYKIK